MKITRKIIGRVVAFVLALVASFSFSVVPFAYAEGEGGSTNGFSMSPMHEKIVLNPGESYTSSFKIRNPATADTPFYYKVSTQPYYRDENNQAIFENIDGRSQIADWVKFVSPEKGVLQPGEATMIEFTINVPETAPAGGQYVSITVSSDNEASGESGNGIKIQEYVAMGYVVYAEISGTTIHRGEIVSANLPSFMISGDITGSSTIKNTGNVHGTATYKLQVYPLFSGEEVYTNEENPDTRLVMPDRTVYFETHWDNTPPIGIFKARYTVSFEGVETVVEKLVIICPIWTIFVIILAILLLVTWLVMKNRGGKKKRAAASANAEGKSE